MLNGNSASKLTQIVRSGHSCRQISSTQVSNLDVQPNKRRVIFSGIQPTGVPHIGNYLGALSQWQNLVKTAAQQSEAERDKLFFSIVGLHAMTVPQDPVVLHRERKDMYAVLLALGLDNAGAVLFQQDQVQEHAELAWYLNCVTPVNQLQRMTSWKSKLADLRNANSEDEIDESLLKMGLFAYPVLQAADILLYQATHVPVGHDQIQHLELARDVASYFNRQYRGPKLSRSGDGKGKGRAVFRLPETMLTNHPRIYSLRAPANKMSKSAADAASKILLTDSPDEIRSKIKSAVTDSVPGDVTWDPSLRPGVANLLQIHAGYSGEDVHTLAKRFTGERGIRDLKESTSDAIQRGLGTFREEYVRIRREEAYLADRERAGAVEARNVASGVMHKVRCAVGTNI